MMDYRLSINTACSLLLYVVVSSNNDDPKIHLTELKQYFQLMSQCHDNLIKMGSTLSNSQYNIIIMSLLLELYQPTLQMITAAEQTNAVLGAFRSIVKENESVQLNFFSPQRSTAPHHQ